MTPEADPSAETTREPVTSIVRVAAVQARPAFLDRDRTLAKTESLIAEAGRHGADLVAFPETWIPGYPLWLYGSAAWDDPTVKNAYARLAANSVTIPGPVTDRLRRAARTAGVTLVTGVSERDGQFSGGTLYNSQLFIDADGSLLGARRKLMPTHAERLLWGRGDGSGLRTYSAAAGRIGGLICWEHWMPLTRFALHALAEQIHVACWPTALEMDHIASRHYAFEGRCFVVCAGAILSTADVPSDLNLPGDVLASGYGHPGSDLLMPGGTGVAGPTGQWVCDPVTGTEQIVYADLDLNMITGEQHVLDTVGHYNRPDIFQLSINSTPTPPLAWRSTSS